MADRLAAAASAASLDAYVEHHRLSGDRSALAVFSRLDSTNRLAATVARAYRRRQRPAPPLIVVAREQWAGRGRRGRRWVSPAGQGIYTSLLLPLPDAAALPALPLRVAVALAEVLTPILAVPCGIKWPNDLMVGGRKLGGILIEVPAGSGAPAVPGPPPLAAVVGYGINVGQQPSGRSAPGATSIREVVGSAPDLARLTIGLASGLMRRLGAPEPLAGVLAAYRRLTVHRAGDELLCRLGEEELHGRFAGFDDGGRLRLETAAGERLLSAADLVETAGAGAAADGR